MQRGRERGFINTVLPSSDLSSLFLVSNDVTSKWKEDTDLTNILVYLRKFKLFESEKVYKIIVAFGKDFQRQEKK